MSESWKRRSGEYESGVGEARSRNFWKKGWGALRLLGAEGGHPEIAVRDTTALERCAVLSPLSRSTRFKKRGGALVGGNRMTISDWILVVAS